MSAHAQSSVTLYGALDTSIEITNPGAGYVTRMDSGANRGSLRCIVKSTAPPPPQRARVSQNLGPVNNSLGNSLHP